MKDEEFEKNNNEATLLKWIFRFFSLCFILLFCYFIIHFEFNNLKNNSDARDSAERIVSDIESSIEKIQDAWNTIYYFYQTGDLMKILKCSTSIKDKYIRQENTLLMMYRENIKTQKTIKNDDISFDDIINVRCGGKITINIGLKDDIYSHSADNKIYTFKLGEEPLELLENYPFVKEALTRLHFGERATFVALPAEKNVFKPQKHTIYEMSIPYSPSTEIVSIPLFMPINKSDEKFGVNDRVVCGSIVQFLINITDINGKKIYSSNKAEKVKVGSGTLNYNIEQVMSQMRVGERYKILLTKQMFKKTDLLNYNLFKENDIVFVDLIITHVQK